MIGNLHATNGILGMPWLHRMDSQILIRKRKVVVQHKGQTINIDAGLSGDTFPMVSYLQINRSFKICVHSCLIYACHDDEKKGDDLVYSGI